MKIKILSFILFFLFTKSAFAQSATFKILVGEEEVKVTEYYNNLKTLFPDNKYVEIEIDVDEDGNKLLKLELPTIRHGKVGFISTISRFHHLKTGEEICTQQLFFCDKSAVIEYLNYFKENYTKSSENSWISEFNENYNVMMEFKKGEGNLSVINVLLKKKPKSN